MPRDTHPDYTAVLNALNRYIGAENGITAAALARQAGCAVRHLRTHITNLRLDGVAVCGTPSTGYFIAANAEELEDCCQFLRTRALTSLLLESRLRKVPMPDLIGQLHLRT